MPAAARGDDHLRPLFLRHPLTPFEPAQPEKSLLIKAIQYQGDVHMPPSGKLQDRDIARLARWVALGMPWTQARTSEPVPFDNRFRITEEQA